MPLTIEELPPDTSMDGPHDEASTLGESIFAETVLSNASQRAHQQETSILSDASSRSRCSKPSRTERSSRSGVLARSIRNDDSVSSLQQKAILANNLDRTKISAIDAEVSSFSTYLGQIDDNDVAEFLLYTAKIKRRYARGSILISGIIERCSAIGIAVDITPLPSAPVLPPVESIPEQKPVEIRRDHNGTPISARGYPHTPWYLHNLAQQSQVVDQPNGFSNDDEPDDNGRDPNGGGSDDPDEDDEPPSRRTHAHGNHRPANRYRYERPDPGNQTLENSIRRRQHSTSLYYTANPKVKMANQVKWVVKSIDGPYAGKHERLAKCSFKLADDFAGAFFVFYNLLKSFLGSNGFNSELLPALQTSPRLLI
jgi:hypothetical protein